MTDRSRMLSSIRKPILLDLFCCQGGAGMGYHRAGFQVVGVDIEPQPKYPFGFVRANALQYLREWLSEYPRERATFSAIHASPPCQHDSDCQRIQGREHADLIAETREAILATGLPYVIENVRGAVDKLRDPVMLCGTMVGVEMYRHRYFETNWPLEQPAHGPHLWPQVTMGRAPKPGEYIQAVGNFSGVQKAREVMGMPWANRDGLREAIPPAYTRLIGERLLEHISSDEFAYAA